jgi:transcriptional regulator with XRE-family HTH domain
MSTDTVIANTVGTTGHRIQLARKLRGWSQVELARRAGYSLSMVKKIEQGARAVDRYGTLHTFARALGVDVGELTMDQNPLARREGVHVVIPQIRKSLTSLPFAVCDGHRHSVDDLRTMVAEGLSIRRSGRYARFTQDLPTLLEALYRAESASPDPEIHSLLTETLHAASILLRRLGYVDLSWLAVQQARQELRGASDPLLLSANDWHVIELHLRTGNTQAARRLTEDTLARLENERTDGPRVRSLRGTLHLLHAILFAHAKDPAGVDSALADAQNLLSRNGLERDDYQTAFGPANVAIFRVSTAVELGQGERALAVSKRFNPRDIPSPERRARYLIDLARAYGQIGKDVAATRVLTEADGLAPVYVRNHVMSRELVSVLMERSRSVPGALRVLARKVSVV